jgi:hypothetical protein
MSTEFYFTPGLHLKDGRIIRNLEDAASFAREQKVRPGVDQRDEVVLDTGESLDALCRQSTSTCWRRVRFSASSLARDLTWCRSATS